MHCGGEHGPRFFELDRHVPRAICRVSKASARPIFKCKLIQQNGAPLHHVQWVDDADAILKLWHAGKRRNHSRKKSQLERGGQLHSWMQQKINNRLGRVIPAKILEIEENEPAIRSAKRIMKTEI